MPAVVGSFPEPFLHGPATRSACPVRVECLSPQDAGLPRRPGGARATTTSPRRRRRCAARSRRTRCASSSARGTCCARTARCSRSRTARPPAASTPSRAPTARSIALLDARGRVVRTLGAGAGLVAATRVGEDQPVWAITGTDDAGVAAAVRAFTARTLRNHFAVAVEPARAGRPVPRRGRSALMYRRRASPLHAARAGVSALYGLALVALALVSTHPLLLGAPSRSPSSAPACSPASGATSRALRALRGPAGRAARGRQRARRARGPDRDRAVRRAAAVRADRRDARGARLRRC